MGVGLSNERRYLTGEVDYRLVRLDAPSSANMGLRNVTMFTEYLGDNIISVDYNSNDQAWLTVSKEIYDACHTPSGLELRREGNTRTVLMKATKHPIYDTWGECELINTQIVPITKSYALK